MAKEWIIENVTGRFVSVHLDGGRIEAFPPASVKPLRRLFRKADGSADVDAAKANQSLAGHLASGDLKMLEREFTPKAGNVGPLYNETDDEPTRVQKVLDWRKKVKDEAKASARPALSRRAKEPTDKE